MEPKLKRGTSERTIRFRIPPYLPPCRVCKSAATGFHYGVNSCEACKGFYRRGVARKTDYPVCDNNGECDITLQARNSCSACRFKKCLSVGMSESAIKTGRYTHNKRTMDTLEIKFGQIFSRARANAITPSFTSLTRPSYCANNLKQLSSYSTTTKRHDQPWVRRQLLNSRHLSTSTLISNQMVNNDSLLNTLNGISNEFRIAFPNTTFVYERFAEINAKVASIMEKLAMEMVTDILSSTGNFTSNQDVLDVERLTTEADVLKSIYSMNSAVSGDLLWEHSDYQQACEKLFWSWLHNIKKFIDNLVKFAQRLPVFDSLPLRDKDVLIKAARAEIAPLIKMKHVNSDIRAIVNYHCDSDTIVLMPVNILEKMLMDDVDGEFSGYQSLFNRLKLEMSSLDVKVSNLSVLCALTLLTPDRKGLSLESRSKLSKVQNWLIAVLSYNLSITHPGDKLSLPRMLMLLPNLRELHEFNRRAMIVAQERVSPVLGQLLKTQLC